MKAPDSVKPVISFSVVSILFCLLIFSCSAAKNAVRFDEQRTVLSAGYKTIQQNLAVVNRQLDSAGGKEQIDDTTRAVIMKKIMALQARVDRSLDSIQQLSYKNGGKTVLRMMQKEYKNFDEQVQLLSDNILLGKLSRLATVVVFPSGQYSLSDSALSGLKDLFPKLFEEINKQLTQYPRINKEVLFSIAGYTDAQSIIPGSDMYKALAAQLPAGQEVSQTAINRQLSAARAKTVKDYINSTYTDNGSKTKNNTAYHFVSYGNGDKLPPTTSAAVKTDDEYRRVVLIYWSILPVVE